MAIAETQDNSAIKQVKFIRESIIKPSSTATTTDTACVIPLSPFDLALAGLFVRALYVYNPPPPPPSSTDSCSDTNGIVVSKIKLALAETLARFRPFAGRTDLSAGRILCNDAGARFVEASANFPLSALNFYSLEDFYSLEAAGRRAVTLRREVITPVVDADNVIPLSLQLTTYACGGFTLLWTFDHVLSDLAGFAMLLSAFSQIGRAASVEQVTDKLSDCYSHDRSGLLALGPPSADSSSANGVEEEQTDEEKVPPEIAGALPRPRLGSASWAPEHWKHILYVVKGSHLQDFRSRTSEGGSRKTRFEALVAYILKATATVLSSTEHDDRCINLLLIFEGRRWCPGLDPKKKFVGNLSVALCREEKVKDLEKQNLGEIASLIASWTQEARSQDPLHLLNRSKDWSLKMSQDQRAPCIHINAVHNLPLMDADFGFGGPRLVVPMPQKDDPNPVHFQINIISSGRGDGSWLVEGAVWPELAELFESDPIRLFRPITADYIFGPGSAA